MAAQGSAVTQHHFSHDLLIALCLHYCLCCLSSYLTLADHNILNQLRDTRAKGSRYRVWNSCIVLRRSAHRITRMSLLMSQATVLMISELRPIYVRRMGIEMDLCLLFAIAVL